MKKFKLKKKKYIVEFGNKKRSGVVEYVTHPETVICLLKENNKYLLINQYRPIFNEWFIEVPGGVVENIEDSREAIIREIEEETGYFVKNVIKLLSFTSSIGLTDEMIHVFKALDFELSGKPHPQPDEIFELIWVGENEILDLVQTGKIKDSKTITALLYDIKYAK